MPVWLLPLVGRLPHLLDLQRLLEQTDLRWSVGTFVILTVGASVSFGFTGLALTNFPIVGLAAAVLGGTLPYLYVRRKRTQRQNAFLEAFADGIELLSRALRAGHAFSTGLQMVADEAAEPMATEFRGVFAYPLTPTKDDFDNVDTASASWSSSRPAGTASPCSAARERSVLSRRKQARHKRRSAP